MGERSMNQINTADDKTRSLLSGGDSCAWDWDVGLRCRAIVRIGLMLLVLGMSANTTEAQTKADPQAARDMLAAQQKQFEKSVVKVADNVFTAVGYHGANTSMIVGDDGVIIIDTLMGPASAANAFKAFREHSDKPVKAIIYTHSHGDHIGGTAAFVSNRRPDIYAAEGFGSAEGATNAVAMAKSKRGARQFGRSLSPEEATNRGVAPSGTIDFDRGKGHLPPTIFVPKDGLKTTIAGVKLELYPAPGETDDAIIIWMPDQQVLFAGDNFYSSFPNLYAIRGTAYRNVLDWSNSVARMAAFKPRAVIPGHTMPIKGQDAATSALSDYSEAIKSVYEQTVAGINAGKSPDQLAHEVKLPEHLRDKPYLLEFYGAVPHAVRSIYTGLLGWYDGNPTTLSPLAPKAKAKKMAALAGGTDNLTEQMTSALKKQDYQWALELSDHVKWLPDADRDLARKTKIKALRGLAARQYNAPNRNYYLTYANELESGQLSDVWF